MTDIDIIINVRELILKFVIRSILSVYFGYILCYDYDIF